MKRDCRFCGTPRLSLGLNVALFLMFCCVVLGASVVLLVVAHERRERPYPSQIVCESGSFEAARSTEDPYLRERATCTVNDSNGRPVPVLIID